MPLEEYNLLDADFAIAPAPIVRKQTNACTTRPTRC